MGIDLASDKTDGDNVRRRGYHFNGTNGDSAGTVTRRVAASLPDGTFNNYAIWWQNQMTINPQWTVSGGLRWTNYRYKTERGLSIPRRVRRRPCTSRAQGGQRRGRFARHRVRARAGSAPGFNVANGYRMPTARGTLLQGAGLGRLRDRQRSAEAGESVSYDTGLRMGVGDLALSGNLFYTTFTDMIDALSVADGAEANGQPTYQIQNIAEARMWGSEPRRSGTSSRGWRARHGDQRDRRHREPTRSSRSTAWTWTGAAAQRAAVPRHVRGALVGHARARLGGASTRYSWRTNRPALPVPGVSQIGAFKAEWISFDLADGLPIRPGQRQLIVLGVRNIADMQFRQAFGSLDEPGPLVRRQLLDPLLIPARGGLRARPGRATRRGFCS